MGSINMAFQASVIYDFHAEGVDELTVIAGDILTITNTDVGQGWVLGVLADGREGIVPEGYIERVTDNFSPPAHSVSKNDIWDDDFDTDDEGVDTEDGGGTPQNTSKYTPDAVVHTRSSSGSSTPGSGGNFSFPFGKSDKVCDYLTSETSTNIGVEAIVINELANGSFQWEIVEEQFTCKIGTPKKSSKLRGMKTFIAYPLTPSFSNIQVSRRYKHFDWLHERLTKKFGLLIPIPPLPEKQAIGRFEEDLIEHRRVQFQSFANRICRHPVLATSEVWKHFVSETDEKKWTQGKRRIENDPNVGISLLSAVQAPSINKEAEDNLDDKITQFSKDLAKVESGVRNMKSVANDQIQRYRHGHTKEYREIGKAFAQLGAAMPGAAPCMSNIGACYQQISEMWDKQVAKDWEPLQRMMHDYKGITVGWHAVLGLYGNIKEKQKEIQKSDGMEKEKISSEAKINTHRIGVEAERTFFKQELGIDMAHASQIFLTEQINFHRDICEKLEKLYYECWPAGEELSSVGVDHS